MVADTRQTRAISAVSPVQNWERYREDAREAILARLLNTSGSAASGARAASPAPPAASLPNGLVRAVVLQANSDSEALVDIGGKSYLVNTRQALSAGSNVILRLLDERTFLQSEGLGKGVGPLGGRDGSSGSSTDSAHSTTKPAEQAQAVRNVRGISPTPMPAPAALHIDSGDARVRLSGSARLLSALAAQADSIRRKVALAPLRIDASTDTGIAAQRIQQAVEQSGLFYESHLQQWREGRRSIEALRAEPQAALSPGVPSKSDTPERPTMTAATPLSSPEQNATRGLQAALGAIPSDVRPLVQDQIALLESSRLALQGFWADQSFTLEIEPDNSGSHDADLPHSWRVRIEMDAPHLGKMAVEVALNGTQTRIIVRPDTKTVRGQQLRDLQTQLSSSGFELQQALDSQGLQMSELSIATNSRSPARS